MDIVDALSEERKCTLQEFRHQLGSAADGLDDFFLYRFLKARDFELDKAMAMINKHFKFREIYELDSILAEYKISEMIKLYAPYFYIGTDRNGNGVLAHLLGRTDLKGLVYSLSTKDHIKSGSYFVENAQAELCRENQLTKKKGRKLVFLMDLDGLSLTTLLDRRVGRHIAHMVHWFADNYPEILECAHVINTPSFVIPWFNFLKRITKSEPLMKVKFYSRVGWREEILKTIDEDKLPAPFGGPRTDPDGNQKCITMFGVTGKIPESYYITNKMDSFRNTDDVITVVVREKSYFNHDVFVKLPKSLIRWSFETIDHNIAFAVYYVPHGVKPMPMMATASYSKSFRHRVQRDPKDGHVVVVPLERIESQFFTEEGEYHCEEAGTYLIHFDNTFSWMTPKKLFYKIQIEPPV